MKITFPSRLELSSILHSKGNYYRDGYFDRRNCSNQKTKTGSNIDERTFVWAQIGFRMSGL